MSDQSLAAPELCARCGKVPALCVCEGVVPLATTTALLILHHPQEQDRELGTARLTALHFANAKLAIGLSWPSLAAALGRPAEPRRWAVLYLGSAKAAELGRGRDIVVLDRRGAALADQNAALAGIEGVVVLDGSWAQAKALWWRNPWVLKCRRVVLGPRRPSHYGALRREPRRDGLATIEAVGMLLGRLESAPEIEATLLAAFDRLLARYRLHKPSDKAPRPQSGRARGPARSGGKVRVNRRAR
jgi:DTW domain-containing protein